jgi:uncharacterized phiE125 gp8 family phage protein
MLRSTRYSREPASRTIEPVTIEEVRRQLRLDHGEDDSDLEDLIVVARRECEAMQLGDRALIEGTVTEYFDEFADEMELHWSPVATDGVSSVKYQDTDNTQQTLATSVYEVGLRNGMAVLRLKYNQTWPTTLGHTADDIVVTYTAGYGDSRSDVPLNIRLWIRARVAWLYENRDGVVYPWLPGMNSLVSPYATGRVIGASA